jgi:hypothetical protein
MMTGAGYPVLYTYTRRNVRYLESRWDREMKVYKETAAQMGYARTRDAAWHILRWPDIKPL